MTRIFRARALSVAGFTCAACALTIAPASAGLLDVINTSFARAINPMAVTAAHWSSVLFYTIVFYEFAWSLVEGLRTQDFSLLLDHWVTRIVTFMVGVWLLQNQVALSQAVNMQIATIATDFTGGNGGVPLTPDGIAMLGWNASGALFGAKSGNFAIDAVAALPLAMSAMCVQLSFIVVAVEDLAMTLGVQFCVAVGGIAVGLMATRWSRPLAAVWPRMMFATLLILVAVNAVAGIGALVSDYFVGLIAQASGQSLNGILGTYVTIGATSMAYLFFGLAIPSLVAFLGASAPISGGSSVVSAVTSVGAFMAGKAAGKGAAAGAGAGKAAIAQLEAATRTS